MDAACTATSQDLLFKKINDLGYRYEWREYPGEHIGGIVTAGLLDPLAIPTFLDGRRVDPNPPHVTYVYDLRASEVRYGLKADHAYWLSGLALRDQSGAAPMGTTDVFSRGYGVADPPRRTTQPISGIGYVGQRKEWGAAPRIAVENVLDITATNISHLTIDVRRAKVGCDMKLNVTSDGPVTITLAGCSNAGSAE